MKKTNSTVSTEVMYLLGLGSYIILVLNLYTNYPIIQSLNNFAGLIANFMAFMLVFILLALIVAIIGLSILYRALKEVKTAIGGVIVIKTKISNTEAWTKLVKTQSKEKFSIYSFLLGVWLVLAIMAGGNFTAFVILLLFIVGGSLKQMSINTLQEYSRVIDLIERGEK